MKAFKKYIVVISYCIGVDLFGFPIFWKNYFYDQYEIQKSKSKYIK